MKPLHHKKHTLAKRFLSLLCILALCLGLLPVTALAVDGIELYVAGQRITESGCYANQNGTWTKVDGTAPASGQFYYDADTVTLTLNGATIQGGTSTGSVPYGAGIYAQCNSGESVSLTIERIGENTITGYYGIYVNAEISENSNGTDASLTITGENNGSLEVSGSFYGIFVKSGTGNASLTINDASVVAKTTQTNSGYAGVCVQSGASSKDSPKLSLAVNGGSLTTSGSASGEGIQFIVGAHEATSATTSLTVTDNAIVDARNGGISASRTSETLPTPTPTGNNSSGIVFDGSAGTVYGNVTLQEDLEIGDGETLTVPAGSSLDMGGNEITVASGGKLKGTPTGNGTVKIAPTITTESLPEGTVDTAYNQTLTATGDVPITWSLASGSALPNGLNLSGDGKITGTPTAAGQFNFTVTATNSAGVVSKQFSLTINSVPVTGVSLNKTALSLFTGESETLTATVAPSNATNKNVTWSSDKPEVATVDNGKVTAKAAGEATITVTTDDGSKTATCKVTVTDKTYAISADTTALNFGSAYTGYAQPAAQTVTVKNTGNQQVTVTLPTSTNYIITAGTNFENGTAILAPNDTATFTVQPKTGLSAGTYSDTITVSGSENVTVTIPASFTVKSRPSYNPPTVSEETTDAIADAQPGETVTVDLSGGDTTLDKEVFETLAGKDVTLVIDLGDVQWTVNGADIPTDTDFTDLDLGASLGTSGIPVNVINTITGEVGTVQITLAHDGEFGFTMTLTAPLGKENAGYWANLYHYKVNGGEADREDPLGDDEDAEALNFEAAAEIDADGSVSLPMSHASQYAIVIDTHSHATVDVSDIFVDVAPNAWYKDAVQYAYDNGLMTGVSDTEFAPEATTTRAMIVSILARLEGVESAQAAGFADVTDDWYATAVNWAASVGVVNGYEDNTFQPNTAITREQLAAILMNYAAYKGEDVSNRADLTSYTDQPSTWAKEAMQWAVAEGLISGVTADTLQPQGAATRAQVAAILQRFLSE